MKKTIQKERTYNTELDKPTKEEFNPRDFLSQKEPEEAWVEELDKIIVPQHTVLGVEMIGMTEPIRKVVRSIIHRIRKEVREQTDKEARILCEMKKRVVRTQTIEEIKKYTDNLVPCDNPKHNKALLRLLNYCLK